MVLAKNENFPFGQAVPVSPIIENEQIKRANKELKYEGAVCCELI